MKLKRAVHVDAVDDPALVERIKAKVIVDPSTGCWLWQGYTSPRGYGQIKYEGKAWWVHRLAFAAMVGEIPAGLTIHHECIISSCCNPDHLLLSTRSDNSKERHVRHQGP